MAISERWLLLWRDRSHLSFRGSSTPIRRGEPARRKARASVTRVKGDRVMGEGNWRSEIVTDAAQRQPTASTHRKAAGQRSGEKRLHRPAAITGPSPSHHPPSTLTPSSRRIDHATV